MHKRIDDAILMQSSKCTQAVLDVLANIKVHFGHIQGTQPEAEADAATT